MSTYIKVDMIESIKVDTNEGLIEVPLTELPESIVQEVRLINDIRKELANAQYEVKKLVLALNSQQSVLNRKVRNHYKENEINPVPNTKEN